MGLGGVLGAKLHHRGVSPDRGFPALWGCSSHEVWGLRGHIWCGNPS